MTEAEFFQAPEDDYTEQFYGFTLAGPIVPQKMRFFVGYIPQFYDTTRTINFRTGGLKETNSEETRHRAIGRLDYSPAQSIQVNGSYMWNPKKTKGLLSGNDFKVTPPSSDFSIQGGYEQANQTSLGVNYIPSSKLLLSARYGYNYLTPRATPTARTMRRTYTYQTGLEPQRPRRAGAVCGCCRLCQRLQSVPDAVRPPDAPQRLSRRGPTSRRSAGRTTPSRVGHAQPPLADDVQSNYPQGFFQVFWNEDFDRAAPYSTSAAPTGITSGRTAFD